MTRHSHTRHGAVSGNERVVAATEELADALTEHADRLRESHPGQGGLLALAASLQLRPGRMERLRSIGEMHAAMGDEDAALDCFRGVVPEALDRRCFHADDIAGRTCAPDACRGVEHRLAHAPQPVPLAAPQANTTVSDLAQFRRRATEPCDAFVSIVERGTLWFDGFNTLVLNEHREILGVQSRGNPALAHAAESMREPLRLEGTVCALDVRSGSIYYHWLLEALPRVGALEHAGISIDSIDHWVVRADAPFQRQTLEALGVRQDRIVSCAGEQHVTADRLVVPFVKNDIGERPATALGLGMGHWVPDWLRKRFWSQAVPTGRTVRRLYISRASRGTRAVANEPELQAMLALRGFERLELETMSIEQQVHVMREAEVVFAPHGAGLANTVFCQPGALVIEAFGNYVVPCYWALAAIAGLDYACFMTTGGSGGSATERAAGVGALRSEGLAVDVSALAGWLDEQLADRAGP